MGAPCVGAPCVGAPCVGAPCVGVVNLTLCGCGEVHLVWVW